MKSSVVKYLNCYLKQLLFSFVLRYGESQSITMRVMDRFEVSNHWFPPYLTISPFWTVTRLSARTPTCPIWKYSCNQGYGLVFKEAVGTREVVVVGHLSTQSSLNRFSKSRKRLAMSKEGLTFSKYPKIVFVWSRYSWHGIFFASMSTL